MEISTFNEIFGIFQLSWFDSQMFRHLKIGMNGNNNLKKLGKRERIKIKRKGKRKKRDTCFLAKEVSCCLADSFATSMAPAT